LPLFGLSLRQLGLLDVKYALLERGLDLLQRRRSSDNR
jgi:hypothetical protein